MSAAREHHLAHYVVEPCRELRRPTAAFCGHIATALDALTKSSATGKPINDAAEFVLDCGHLGDLPSGRDAAICARTSIIL
jgi:hypothetical protein